MPLMLSDPCRMALLRLASIEDDTTAHQLLPGYLCHQPEFTCSLVAGSVE